MRVAFGAFVCATAIGCFVGDLLFFDFFGPLIVVPLSLISFAVVGALLVVRRAGGAIGWLLGAAGALLLNAVRDTVQPAHASVWLREVARL